MYFSGVVLVKSNMAEQILTRKREAIGPTYMQIVSSFVLDTKSAMQIYLQPEWGRLRLQTPLKLSIFYHNFCL